MFFDHFNCVICVQVMATMDEKKRRITKETKYKLINNSIVQTRKQAAGARY